MNHAHQLQRHLRLFDATTIVVGSMIGSGIFIALSIMAQWVETPGLLIGLWIFGELLPLAAQVYVPHCLLHFELSSAQLVACGAIALLTGVNIRGVREGALVQNVFTVLKVAALVALIVAGLTYAKGAANFFPLVAPIPGGMAVEVGFCAGLAVALSKALFAYDAW